MTLGGTPTHFLFPWLCAEEGRCWVEWCEIVHPRSTQVHFARNGTVDHEVLIVLSEDLKLKQKSTCHWHFWPNKNSINNKLLSCYCIYLWKPSQGNPAPSLVVRPLASHPHRSRLPNLPVGRWHGFMLQQRQQRMPRYWACGSWLNKKGSPQLGKLFFFWGIKHLPSFR